MCGRFALFSTPHEIMSVFSLKEITHFEPSYNIAPSQNIMIICALPEHQRTLVQVRWGLVPSWQREEQISSAMINARIETIESKPAFRNAWRHRRCLIIADGFYEWSHDGNKQPHFFHLKNNKPFAMAGIWERWIGNEKSIVSCSIITLAANKLIEPFHNRMPAIIRQENYDLWLNPENEQITDIKKLIVDYPEEELEQFPVDKKVNNPRYNYVDCITPV